MINPQPLKTNPYIQFLRSVRGTILSDKKLYQTKNRKLSLTRLWSLIQTNLKQPVFIIGAPRSGTTFLGNCLAHLPELSYHFEPHITKIAATQVYENSWSFAKARWFYQTAYSWLMRIHLDADLRFAEKTPRNCFLIPFLSQVFPDAQFIHIIRDGRDSALSYSKKPWLQSAQANSGKFEPGGYPYGPYPRFWVESERRSEFSTTSDIHRCIWAWRKFNEAVMAAKEHLSEQKYYQVRYEDLVSYPKREAEKILDFLGIDCPESRQCFVKATCKAKTNSLQRWQLELSSIQLQEIDKEAGELLSNLGYKN